MSFSFSDFGNLHHELPPPNDSTLDIFLEIFLSSSDQLFFKHRQKQPPEVFYKNSFLKNFAKFTGKHLCPGLFFSKVAYNFIEKKTLAQVFFCEFCEILKNNFVTEHLCMTAPPKRSFINVQYYHICKTDAVLQFGKIAYNYSRYIFPFQILTYFSSKIFEKRYFF